MPTEYRGYTELPGAVTPDVPYRVNLALREIDADVHDLQAAATATAARLAGRVAQLEGSKAGDPLKVEDERAAALVADRSSRVSAQLSERMGDDVPGIVAGAVQAPGPLRAAVRAAADEVFPGPLSRWGNALDKSATAPAIWVSLGSSTAHGGSATQQGLSWSNRCLSYLSAEPRGDLAAATSRPASGVHLYSGALGGQNAGNYVGEDRLAKIRLLNPALVTHMIGSNDYAALMTLDTYRANLRKAVADVVAAAPEAVQVLVHQQARIDITAPRHPWEAFGQVMAEVAAEFENAVFLNVDKDFRRLGLSPTGDRAGLLVGDKIHMGNAGHRVLADLVMDFLGTPMRYMGSDALRTSPLAGGTFTDTAAIYVLGTVTVPPKPYPRRASAHLTAYGSTSGNGELILNAWTGTSGETTLPEGGQANARMNGTASSSYHVAGTWLIPANTAARFVARTSGGATISSNANYGNLFVDLTDC